MMDYKDFQEDAEIQSVAYSLLFSAEETMLKEVCSLWFSETKEILLETVDRNIQACFIQKLFWIFLSIVIGGFIAFMKIRGYYSAVMLIPLAEVVILAVLMALYQEGWKRKKIQLLSRGRQEKRKKRKETYEEF